MPTSNRFQALADSSDEQTEHQTDKTDSDKESTTAHVNVNALNTAERNRLLHQARLP